MEMFLDVAAFSLKALLCAGLVLAVVIVSVSVLTSSRRRRSMWHDGELMVDSLNKRYEWLGDGIRGAVLGKKKFRQLLRKRKRKKGSGKQGSRPRVFVFDFKGDVGASAVSSLREEITAVLAVAEEADEVVIRLESAGGLMPSYGLAASQLARIKERSIPLSVCVDKVAASGGYMMASVADRIIAGPFAIVGSIGVVAMLPNLHKFLKHHNVDYEELTAGEFKRTVSLFGEITEKGRTKFLEELEDSHMLFKEFVKNNRPSVDIDTVATGEHWYGTLALERNLVDALQTSDDFLMELARERDVFQVQYLVPKPIQDRLAGWLSGGRDRSGLASPGPEGGWHLI